jgi:UDP-N-acetylglucosamine 2-epimerase (non-hydrolysing)
MLKILSVVGARPQFVKLAPVAHATQGRAEHVVVHTGQHYDELMSDVFFRDLGIPLPDENLAVGSGRHGAQTGAMLAGLEEVFENHAPDWVLVYGDTNSTLAAALAAVKMHLPVAHLEAGLRSFNRRMPEEHNRVLTDHAADLLLAPTQAAAEHLRKEGLADRTVVVGDVMTDVLLGTRSRTEDLPLPEGVTDSEYYVATIHRADNTDDPVRLQGIVDGLAGLDRPVLLLAHPRLVARAADHGIDLAIGVLDVRAPFPYPQLVRAVDRAAGVITDSGGLQKEAFLLRTPTTTVRSETEWAETLEHDWNVLVEPTAAAVRAAVLRPQPEGTDATPYGDGQAARRVVDALLRRSGTR